MRTLVALALCTGLWVPQEAIVGKPEHFSAVLTAGPVSPTPLSLDIAINHWATDEDRARLAAAFDEGGGVSLLAMLRKEPACCSTSPRSASPRRKAWTWCPS